MASEKPSRPPPPQRPPPPMSTGQISVEVLPLQPHEARWYYKEPGRFWIPFNGYDSLMLEERYQRLCRGDPGDNLNKKILAGVLGDMYDANVMERSGTSVYWKGWLRKVISGFKLFNVKRHADKFVVRQRDGFIKHESSPLWCTILQKGAIHMHMTHTCIHTHMYTGI